MYSTPRALQIGCPHKPGGGPEQDVDLIKKKKVVNTSIYPDEVIERLARCFYPAILEYFNSEEGQRAFAAWQAEQARLTAKEKQDVPNGERPALHTDRKRLFSDEAYLSGCAFLFVLQCSFGAGGSFPTQLPMNTKNPNPSPIGKRFGFCVCGADKRT